MKISRVRTRGWLSGALVMVWLVVALGALFPMYRLWVTREWRMYGGKSVSEQRSALFEHLGFDGYLLRDTELIAAKLPPNANYRLVGDFNRLSYVKYLLIPRIPGKQPQIRIEDTGNALIIEKAGTDLSAAGPAPVPFEHPARLSAFLLAILLAVGSAYLFWRWVPGGPSYPQAVALSLLSGLALASTSRGVFSNTNAGFMIWAAGGGVGLATLAGHLIRKPRRSRDHLKRRSPGQWPLVAVLTGASLYLVWSLLMAVVVVPDDWDAWAMWGAKAKVLALGTGPLVDVTWFGSGEYPLLWPALWAFTGWLAGGWEESWSKGWGVVLLLLTAWQMLITANRRGSGAQGAARFLGPLLFVTMPCVALVASWGYAEPAYWLMLACAWSSLTELRQQPTQNRAILSGFMLTAAMYTKNEGFVFWMLVCAWLSVQRGVGLRQKITVVLVPAILFAPWFFWTRVALDLGTSSTGGFLTSVGLTQRIASSLVPVSIHILSLWGDVRLWGVAGLILGGCALWAFVRGNADERGDLALVAFLFLTYLGVVLCGRNDPGWQIGAAWNRLSIHLLLLTVMILTPRLERLMNRAY